MITGLDGAVQHVSATVPARGRGYFDVQVPVSSSYRVDVDSFEFVEGAN